MIVNLIDECMRRKSTDNLTALIISLKDLTICKNNNENRRVSPIQPNENCLVNSSIILSFRIIIFIPSSAARLMASLIDRCEAPRQCDLNRIVDQAMAACLAELATPILVRQRLAEHLPSIACNPAQLTYAAQRALMIAAGRLDGGGELLVTTRQDADAILLEIESRGGHRDRHLRERGETLCEFVAALRGHCRIDLDHQGNLLVVIELPEAMVFDDR